MPPTAPPTLGVSYTYPWGMPLEYNGYYNDPDRTLLTDGYEPSTIEKSNCVGFEADREALFDLGALSHLATVRVSYLARPSWGT